MRCFVEDNIIKLRREGIFLWLDGSRWANVKLTKQSFGALREENIPKDVLENLHDFENKEFTTGS